MEDIRKNKTIQMIAIGAGLATVAAISLYFVKKVSKKASPIIVKQRLTKNEKTEIINQLKTTINKDSLTPSNIAQITATTYKFSSADFVNLTLQNRKERRGLKADLPKYVKIWEEHSEKMRILNLVCEEEVLKGLGISNETWSQTKELFIQHHNQEMQEIYDYLAEKQAEDLGTRKSLSMEEFIKVIKRKTELFQSEYSLLPTIKSLVVDPSSTGELIYQRVTDFISEEFDMEEEEVVLAIQQLSHLPQCQSVFRNYIQTVGRVLN